jgi:UDP-N-acetylglucosamine--N-acetylmuramyl-(pentapeptide) pyrophosphoryl-undecaprenol N-acetylglucosamine transferase
MKKRVLIAAGGTGGHVFPGVAIASELIARGGYSVAFAGTHRGVEERVIGRTGWPLYFVDAPSIKGKSFWRRMLSILRLPIALLDALRILTITNPVLVISIGGYAAGPLSIMAWVMRIPVTVVEPNAIPGLSNRILGRFAKKIFTAFDAAAPYFDGKKLVKSGMPVRPEVLGALRESEMPSSPFTVFVFGGSQGAAKLNCAIIDACKIMKGKYSMRIIHQTGALKNIEDIKKSYRESGFEAEVYEFVDKIWECYSKADFVIARAGAGTVAELAALKIPSILVPYPFAADDHQRANAKALVDIKGALMLEDKNCTGEKLASMIGEIIDDVPGYLEMRAALAGLCAKNAVPRIVDESVKLITDN